MSNINIEIGKRYIERARREGFELYVLPGQGQIRIRQVGQMTHQPSDGTPEGNAAKAAAEQFDGEIRQMSIGLSADVNNNRGSILIALNSMTPQPAPPPPPPPAPAAKMPGFGGPESFGVFDDGEAQ